MNARWGRRAAPVVLLVGALAAGKLLAPSWPTAQSLAVVLGDGATRVTELRIRYAPRGRSASRDDGDLAREVSFRYPAHDAPRVVHHDLRAPNGDYDVRIDVAVDAPRPATTVVEKTIALGGGAATVDVNRSIRAIAESP